MLVRIKIDFSAFSDEELENRPTIFPEVIREPIVPVPAYALPMHFLHPNFGLPKRVWPYFSKGGQLVGYVAGFDDTLGTKHYLPLTFCRTGVEERWHAYSLPRPYSFYNLPALEANRGDEYVLIVRGESNVEAAKTLFPDSVSLCCPYGDAGIHNADWTVLNGRRVVVAPHVE